MPLSVDVIVAAHDQLSGPFAGMEESAQRFAFTMDAVRERVRTWSVDELVAGAKEIETETPGATEAIRLLGSTAGRAGLGLERLGPITRALALTVRSSGETAKAGWIGILGPIALVAAAIGGMVAIIKKVERGWAEQAEAAKKAMEEERAAAKARADFFIEQELRIARARGDSWRAFNIEGRRAYEATVKEIEERYEKEVAEKVPTHYAGQKILPREQRGATPMERNAQGQWVESHWVRIMDEQYEYQQQVLAGVRARRDEELNALEAANRAEVQAFESEERRKREEQAKTEAAARTRIEAEKKAVADTFAALTAKPPPPPEEPEPGTPEYQRMQAFESMLVLLAPGQDPMQRQVKLTERLLSTLEKVEKNTKPSAAGWEPAPVY